MLRYVSLLASVFISLALNACGYTPKQLGITGPGTGQTSVTSHASEEEQDAIIPDPGLPAEFGSRYAPALVPHSDENGRFYGYN